MRAPDSHVLLSNGSAASAYFKVVGGRYVMMAEATWGGGSVQLQIKGPNGTAIDIASASLSANGSFAVDLPAGAQVRLNVTTATAVYAVLTSVPND